MKYCIGTAEVVSLASDGAPTIVKVSGISSAATVITSAQRMARAIRLLEPVAEFPAANADELYEGARKIPWQELLARGQTLAVAAIDLGGRPHAAVDLKVKIERVGDLQTELVHDFFEGFAIGARANVHVKVLYGRSSHHKIEAVFKAFARALRVACAKDRRLARMLPSTKGLL